MLFILAYFLLSIILFCFIWYFKEYIYLIFPSLSVPYTHLIGVLSKIYVPVWLRSIFYHIFGLYHGINMKEAKEENYKVYENFSELFIRPLKKGIRPIAKCSLVSPVDGKIIQFGELINKINRVKGQDYQFEEFLGPIDPGHKSGNKLYQVVIFLGPADYHCFHSPAEWAAHTKIEHKGTGLILPFRIHTFVPHWFSINSRVCLIGKWKYGFFSMSPVGACTVGDIHINETHATTEATVKEKSDKYIVYDQKFDYKRGDKVGEFHAGSLVVLIFEAPPDLNFCIMPDQHVCYGNSLIASSD